MSQSPLPPGQPCCTARRNRPETEKRASSCHEWVSGDGTGQHTIEQASIPAQRFRMGDHHGDGYPVDGERPPHSVQLSAFEIDTTCVTNTDFARFVKATGYRTDAERFGYSAVFHLEIKAADRADILGASPDAPWWYGVRQADWRHPCGRGSSLEGLEDHPVIHVSWQDAVAYCDWASRRLPTEAEWEAASRGGHEGKRYPWGDDLLDEMPRHWRLNIWQGDFPDHNLGEDGYSSTAPVRSYRPNDYGLWQTVGNVWEWCHDRFSRHTYHHDSAQGIITNPAGPILGETRVLRGGSYLCHASYCNRYRNAARTSNTPDSSMGNVGFRTVGLRRR